jgi:L-arabinose transport system permease protein
VFGILLNRTVFGRNTLAIGGNKEAALLAGIRVDRTKIAIFALSGMAAAFAGIVSASRLVVASNNAGEKLELQAISACVLGGVSLSGGIGTMSGTVVGVLIMGIVENVMRLRNIDAFYQLVVTGTILLMAVLFDRVKLKLLKQA